MFERTPSAIRFAEALQRREQVRSSSPMETAGSSLKDWTELLETRISDVIERVTRRTTAVVPADRRIFEAEEAAAVSGRFDPREVFGRAFDDGERGGVAALGQLASSCIVQVVATTTTWTLDVARRTEVLTRLIEEHRLEAQLDGPLWPTDRFGDMLRELLRRGQDIVTRDLAREDLLALSAAMEATREVPIPRPDPAQVHAQVARSRFLAPYEGLLDHFVGRSTELAALHEIVAGAGAAPKGWTGVVLAGLGGAGKSALLAMLARDLMAAKSATVVILDFDRPGIDPTDRYWLEMEITRQIAYQYPETDATLRALRRAMREQKAVIDDGGQGASFDAAAAERGLRASTIAGIRGALKIAEAAERPLLLMLDTFEEVVQRDLTGRTGDWLIEMAGTLLDTPVVVIFSGRLYDESREKLAWHGVTRTIEVGEMDAPTAEALLLNLDVPKPLASRLARSTILPLRPLELKLMARLFTTSTATSVESLEEDMQRGGAAAQELFAGIVYRRVLKRLSDNPRTMALASPELLQKLASPGLVLRFVTADIIQRVLVPALSLPPMSEQEAANALEALASFEWLTTRAADGTVWHRRDLRRSMLKTMIAEEPGLARAIHKEAVNYFSDASTAREQAEATYHRLMALDVSFQAEDIAVGALQRASAHIAGDFKDLPPTGAALMGFATNVVLKASEVVRLPTQYMTRAYHETGALLSATRQFGAALQLYGSLRPDPYGEIVPPPRYTRSLSNDDMAPWEIDTLFATACWRMLAQRDRAEMLSPDLSWQAIVDFVFPDAFVSPRRARIGYCVAALSQASRFQAELSTQAGQEQLARLAMAVVLLSKDSPLSSRDWEGLIPLLTQIESLDRRPSPSLARRLLLLERVSQRQPRHWDALPVSPLTMVLNHSWLALLSRHAKQAGDTKNGAEVVSLIDKVRQLLNGATREATTVRGLLGAVNELAIPSDGVPQARLPLRAVVKELWALLRGLDPEFRDPCRFALIDAFPGNEGIRQLGVLFASTIPLTLQDLYPDAFVASAGDNIETALESYVELADRAGVLGMLLERAHQQRPRARKLSLVRQAHSAWRAAERALLDPYRSPEL